MRFYINRHIPISAIFASIGFLLFTPGFVGAQTRSAHGCHLAGLVRNVEGTPLPGARVILSPGDLLVMADDQGRFCFDRLEEREYRVLAEMREHADQTFSFEFMASKPVELEIVLRSDLRERVTVEALLEATKLEVSPVRVEVVPRQMIEQTASRTLADALDFMTGVRIDSNCQNCNFSQVRLLGLDGAYSQILIDGQPLISSLSQVYSIEQIPARMVDRIEVIKGGGSAHYGAGAVAGAINVIPREAKENGGWVDTSFGWMAGLPTHSQQGVFDLVGSNGATALTLFGQLDRIHPYDRDGDGFTELGTRSLRATGARLTRRVLNEKGKLVADFGHVWEYRRGGDRLKEPEHFALIAESTKMSRTTASLGWAHYIGADTFYRLAFSTAYSSRDSYYGSGQDPNAYGTSNSPLYIVDSQVSHNRENHLLSAGFQHSSDYLRDSQPGYGRYTDEVYRNAGVFVQDTWSFAPKWELLAGVRLDGHSEVAGTFVSPRLALKWEPSAFWSFRGSAARGFRPPQVFDEDLHITQIGGTGAIIRNAENLRHERAASFMLGGEWNRAFGEYQGMIETNFFHTRISDQFKVIAVDDPLTEELEFERANLGYGSITGVEINGGFAWGTHLRIEGGHVIQRGRHGEPEPEFGIRNFFRTPSQQSNLTVVWADPHLADFFFGFRRVGRMQIPHYAGFIPETRLEHSPSFYTCDVNAMRAFQKANSDQTFTVTVGVKNLTDVFQKDLDRGPNRDSGYFYGPRFPRTAYVNFKVSF